MVDSFVCYKEIQRAAVPGLTLAGNVQDLPPSHDIGPVAEARTLPPASARALGCDLMRMRMSAATDTQRRVQFLALETPAISGRINSLSLDLDLQSHIYCPLAPDHFRAS